MVYGNYSGPVPPPAQPNPDLNTGGKYLVRWYEDLNAGIWGYGDPYRPQRQTADDLIKSTAFDHRIGLKGEIFVQEETMTFSAGASISVDINGDPYSTWDVVQAIVTGEGFVENVSTRGVAGAGVGTLLVGGPKNKPYKISIPIAALTTLGTFVNAACLLEEKGIQVELDNENNIVFLKMSKETTVDDIVMKLVESVTRGKEAQ